MDDPERYSGKDGSLSVNGEFVTVDEYVLLKLRNCEIKKQNKMLREALNEIRDQPLSAPEIDDLIDKVMEQTKC